MLPTDLPAPGWPGLYKELRALRRDRDINGLTQRPPKPFLALGTGFMEVDFSTDKEAPAGYSSVLPLTSCAVPQFLTGPGAVLVRGLRV